MIGVPTQQEIAGVGVNRSEQAVRCRRFNLMLERVAGEGRMIGLEVELEMLVETVRLQEGNPGGNIEIILMLGGLHWLGLDQELPRETNGLGVIDRHMQERRQVFLFPLEIGIQQGFVAFPPAPEDIVLTPKLLGDLQCFLHLRRGIREHVGVRVRGCTAHIPRIGEKIGRAPEELHAGGLLQLLRVGDKLVEIPVGLDQTAAFRRDVAVMETPEGRLDLDEELEGGIHPRLGDGDGILALLPRADDGARTEWIGAYSAKRMPIGDGEAQVLLQRLAVDHLVRIVVLEG